MSSAGLDQKAVEFASDVMRSAAEMRKRSTHTKEVVKEALPADVAQRLEALEGMAQAVADLSERLANLLHTFDAHVHEPPPEMAELAQRVQALEMLARRAA